MTIRKNFLFEQEVAEHLAELAKEKGKTQTQITQEAIEKIYKEMIKTKKLEALKNLKESPTAKVGDVDLKEIRLERAMHRGE